MRRLRLYLDTSVWNFLFADNAPEKKKCTEILFSEIKAGKHSIFISTEVEKEISVAPIRKRQLLAATLERCRPLVFDHTEESRSLVYSYMSNGLLSDKHLADLNHIALASINEMDILVSWNMRHIVKVRTKSIVNAVNQLNGYRNIEISTPEEVITYGN